MTTNQYNIDNLFTDAEVLSIFNKAMNAPSLEEKQAKKRNNIRKGKADFCNLKAQKVVFIAD